MQLFVHRMNQTAHISLQIPSISNSVETKVTGCAVSLWRAPPLKPLIFASLPSASALSEPLCWSVWRSVVRLSAAGEGVFTVRDWGPQELFSKKMHFL